MLGRAAAPPRAVHGFRRDIHGLRAVAILAVVGYHAAVPHMGGGYVGVDVFFVISGYLITNVLARELEGTGRISFSRFYARRARRILPSAVLVVAATTAVSVMVLSPLREAAVLHDALAAALYVANYRFAFQATDYLSLGAAPSPFLHYWSLGVEEQFYLVWPALVVLAALVVRRRGRRRTAQTVREERGRPEAMTEAARARMRRAALAALCIVGTASFAVSLWLTRVDESWAFYSLASRAWELAAGGAVALAGPTVTRLPRALAAFVGWAGLASIVYGVVAFSPATPFPGTAALLPVGGAMAIVAAGSVVSSPGPGSLLGVAPFQWVGTVSYTWYLWHWPALVLGPAVVGHPLDLPSRLGALGVGLVLAIATTLAIERPLWHARSLRVPLRAFAVGLGGSALAALLALSAPFALSAPKGHGHVRHTALALGREAAPGAVASTRSATLGAYTQAGAAAAARALSAQVHAAVVASVGTRQVPANIDPPLTQAPADEAAPFVDGCFDGFPTTSVNPCLYGDTTASRTMVLFGDSHALMWFPAFDAIANRQHWRLIAAAKATCPPLEVRIFSPDLDQWYTQCTQWRNAEVARIRALHPALVVLGFSREYGVTNDHVLVDGPAWMHGLAAMVSALHSTGAQVVVMGAVPYPTGLVPACLATHLSDATACLIPNTSPHVDHTGIAQERTVVARAGGTLVNVYPWFCAQTSCAAMVENMVVYRDDNHITATYATWLTPAVTASLAAATDLTIHPPTAPRGPSVRSYPRGP